MHTLDVDWSNVHNMEPYGQPRMHYKDQECGLHISPKLSNEDTKLTLYSIMNVKLTSQVSNSTVSKTLVTYGLPEAAGTAKFLKLKKSLSRCFTSVNNNSFGWLQIVFLNYYENWLGAIEQRPGNLLRNAPRKMFFSWQTLEGLKITVHSIIETNFFGNAMSNMFW